MVEGGLPTEATVAHVLVSRYADHLPLYRQAGILARQGILVDRATLASWVGTGAAEIVLRFLPVSEGLRTEAVNHADPVFHFTPEREAIWSRGWRFEQVNRVRVNNAGYVNDQRYDPADPRPLLAVVGDSYVEASMVPYARTLHGRLATAAGPSRCGRCTKRLRARRGRCCCSSPASPGSCCSSPGST